MVKSARILIVDDEETFLLSTADLLRREGYECDCAVDSKTAVAMLEKTEYNLLVADIQMPGNVELELIQAVPQTVEGLPVILVTGYPSLKTAIHSIRLPVLAYLIKPLDFNEFLAYVKIAVGSSRLYHDFLKIRKRLGDWNEELEIMGGRLNIKSQNGFSLPIQDFLALNYQNIVSTLSDLIHLTEALGKQNGSSEICHLLNCPRMTNLKDILAETVDVVKKTKSAFKSKDLGELRIKLEGLVKRLER